MHCSGDTLRTIDEALVDLYNKLDRIPEASRGTRFDLERMIDMLEAEINDRGARVLASYS
jgi:hypothetical protein